MTIISVEVTESTGKMSMALKAKKDKLKFILSMRFCLVISGCSQ